MSSGKNVDVIWEEWKLDNAFMQNRKVSGSNLTDPLKLVWEPKLVTSFLVTFVLKQEKHDYLFKDGNIL